MAREDFVDVRLTAAGVEHAGGGDFGISVGKRRFDFVGGKPVNVEKSYEWFACLRDYRLNGQLMFELVPPAPAVAGAAAQTASANAPVVAK
jgi:hypothetical protein